MDTFIRSIFRLVPLLVTSSSKHVGGALFLNHLNHYTTRAHLIKWNGILVHHYKLKKDAQARWVLGLEMANTIIRFEDVPTFGYNQMYKLSTKKIVLQGTMYSMLIGQYLWCMMNLETQQGWHGGFHLNTFTGCITINFTLMVLKFINWPLVKMNSWTR